MSCKKHSQNVNRMDFFVLSIDFSDFRRFRGGRCRRRCHRSSRCRCHCRCRCHFSCRCKCRDQSFCWRCVASAPALELPRVQPARVVRKRDRLKESDFFLSSQTLCVRPESINGRPRVHAGVVRREASPGHEHSVFPAVALRDVRVVWQLQVWHAMEGPRRSLRSVGDWVWAVRLAWLADRASRDASK